VQPETITHWVYTDVTPHQLGVGVFFFGAISDVSVKRHQANSNGIENLKNPSLKSG
jgi:hypothetical protein